MLHCSQSSWGAPSKPKICPPPVFSGPRLCARRAEEVKVFPVAVFQKPPYRAANLDSTGTLESEADKVIDRSSPSCLTFDEGWPSPSRDDSWRSCGYKAWPAHLDLKSQTLEQGEAFLSARLGPSEGDVYPKRRRNTAF